MNPFAARGVACAWLALNSTLALAAAESGDDAIAAVMAGAVKPSEPGCTVGVVQGGTLKHARAFGLADLERGRPLDTHSVFNLASVSKQFTAFALLLLEQDGKLKLDDPLAKFVPELAASSRGVTLRHLVHHTGGLRDYIELLTMRGRGDADGATIHEAVQALARQTKPNEAPGVEYDYSNTGYFLLGVVIARVSGQTLAEFSRARIFEPLGMKNTSIVDSYPPAGSRWATARYTATCMTWRSGTRISTRARSAAESSSRGCTRSASSIPASPLTMLPGSASTNRAA
jgi:CubicO group peptidase (beta-lactamase class C family)